MSDVQTQDKIELSKEEKAVIDALEKPPLLLLLPLLPLLLLMPHLKKKLLIISNLHLLEIKKFKLLK